MANIFSYDIHRACELVSERGPQNRSRFRSSVVKELLTVQQKNVEVLNMQNGAKDMKYRMVGAGWDE